MMMRIKDKRGIFNAIRANAELDEDTFIPAFALFVGEFCVWQILTEYSRKSEKSSLSSEK